MIIYSIITMKDLMRHYRMLLKRKNESDSESESQPLMSSSCSSTKSFGTVTGSPIFSQDSYSENEDTFKYSVSPNSPVIIKTPAKKLGIPQLDIFAKEKPKYEQLEEYTTIAGFIDPPLVNKSTTLDSFIDYKIIEEIPTNSSLVTIFATWNTTMGTSLLAMSWGLEKTGLFPGIAINIIVAALCLYTAYILLNVNQKHSMLGQNNEAFDLCRMLIGKWAEVLAKIFSIIVLIGSNIVYWILMANFLYNSVDFVYGSFVSPQSAPNDNLSVICPKNLAVDSKNTTNFLTNTHQDNSLYSKVWDLYSTVPIFLGIIMFPMLNFKSATFFTKFNSLGTISVLYILIFVAIKSYNWGINIPDWSVEFKLKPTFCALSGMLSLSYFIHNIIISIMRNNRLQENNGRDLSIAFCLITFTYLFIGVTFYVCFPLAKSCIEDNILNNFSKHDVLTLIARILLLFQLFTVFPLITYMLRMDILTNINMIFKNYRFGDFTYGRVIIINSIILIICIMFACFLPRIGTLIRYTGALSGLVYVFLLPSLLKIASLKKEDNLTILKLIFHIVIIILGVLNLCSQFFINDN